MSVPTVIYDPTCPPSIPANVSIREYRQARAANKERRAFRITLLIGWAVSAVALVRGAQYYRAHPNG